MSRRGGAAGADRRSGLRACRAGRPSSGRQHPQAPAGGYRLRFGRNGEHAHAPGGLCHPGERRTGAVEHGRDGRADCNHDRRYRALVLLATFASLRWGEVDRAAPLRYRPEHRHGAGPGRVCRAVNRRDPARRRRSPGPAAAWSASPARSSRYCSEHLAIFVGPSPGALVVPRRQGRPAAAGQLQQDVRLAARGPRDRRGRPALPRSPAYRESPSRRQAAPGCGT